LEELEMRDRVGGEVDYLGLQAAGEGRREREGEPFKPR
jgi:hypothetical protein